MAKPTEMASKIAGKLQGIAKRLEGYRGIFRRLAEEHTEVKVLMRRVRASRVDDPVRRELFPKIRRELLAHARAEEQEVYSLLREFDDTRALIEHSATENRRVEVLLEQLTISDCATTAWSDTFDTLVRIVEGHVDEEQSRVFPRARELLSDTEVLELEGRYLRAKQQVLLKTS